LALLDLLPGACHLAVYVAMCAPDAPGEGGGGVGAAAGALRRRTVLELLARYCPEWAGDEERQAFLTQRLGVPAAWLHEAAAQVRRAPAAAQCCPLLPCCREGPCRPHSSRLTGAPPPPSPVSPQWAGYSHDARRQCAELLAAGAWARAHEVLAARIAPPLLLRRGAGHAELLQLLQRLEPHAAEVPAWPSAGGLYLAYLRGVAPAAQPAGGSKQPGAAADAAAAAAALLRAASAVAGAAAPAEEGAALGRSVGLGLMVGDALGLLARAGPPAARLGLEAPGVTGAARGSVIARVAGELSRLVAVQQ
jgi:hypothetical protein